jgi:hypothetical protein
MATDLTPLIAQAVALKQQMNAHIITLYGRLTDPDAFTSERDDATKVLTRQYAPAIQKIVDATTPDDLAERHDSLNTRLNKGWTHCHLNPADEAAYDLWEALLLEYSVLGDALNHIEVIAGTEERIGWIESFVMPAEGAIADD